MTMDVKLIVLAVFAFVICKQTSFGYPQMILEEAVRLKGSSGANSNSDWGNETSVDEDVDWNQVAIDDGYWATVGDPAYWDDFFAGSPSNCTTGDDGCCNSDNLCDVNEGDCDTDSDCMEGLECGVDNCIAYNIKDGIEGWEWDYEDDCCYNPLVTSGCTGGNGCCTAKFCFEGEGDCDSDYDCNEGLVCGTDNCMSEFAHVGNDWDDTDDCCTSALPVEDAAK